MRVIGGSARGRRLRTPAGRGLRPTPARVREALFDIVAASVSACRFLDLYAGSGAVGIEALSRGAASAVFVEQDRSHLEVLRENLRHSGMAQGARVLGTTVGRALGRLQREGAGFDLIFADPPYRASEERDRCVAWLGRPSLVGPAATVVLEMPARDRGIRAAGGLELLREVRYGDTLLAFLRRSP